MNDDEINDARSCRDFRGITFSKYKKGDARKELLNCLKEGKLEPACYWSAEFVCAGHYLDLWETILLFVGKHIHLGNPRIPCYIALRYENFKTIVMDGYAGNELMLRNHPKIRKIFAEIVCILCLSTKKHPYSTIKIKKTDFASIELTDKLKAKNISYGQQIFRKEDPKELFIAINEFAYHLSETRNVSMACYWIEWIMEFETTCIKEKSKKLIAQRREFAPVESKLQKDIIWIVWDILLRETAGTQNMKKVMKALLDIFCIRYRSGMKKKRRYLMYFAVSLLVEASNPNIPIVTEERKIEGIKSKINIIYRQIKKNEITPKTDYLFNNSICEKTKNLEKTIHKLDKMSSLTGFIPRI